MKFQIALATAGLCLSAAAVQAATVAVPFQRITNNSPIGASLASQFELQVSDRARSGGSLASDQVRFSLRNVVGIASSITTLVFDNSGGVLDEIDGIADSAGATFAQERKGKLPAGNNQDFDADFTVAAQSQGEQGGTSNNGLNAASEWLDVIFELDDDFDGVNRLANVEQALRNGKLRLGMHVQALADGASESYLSSPPPGTPPAPTPVVPLPPAALAGVGLLGVVGVVRSRRRRD